MSIAPGQTFQASFRNVNLKARSTKEGMVYRFEAEITEEDWDLLRRVDLTGSLFEANLECVEVRPKKEEKPKGGSLSQSAAMLCNEKQFQLFMRSVADDYRGSVNFSVDMEEGEVVAREMILFMCCIKSRAELDHNPEAAKRFHELMKEYREWNK